MEKFKELIKKCKGSVTIEFNNHRDCYQSINQYLEEIREDDLKEVEIDVLRGMVKKDTIIELQFYPDTPNGFYKLYHHDLDSIIDIALSTWQ